MIWAYLVLCCRLSLCWKLWTLPIATTSLKWADKLSYQSCVVIFGNLRMQEKQRIENWILEPGILHNWYYDSEHRSLCPQAYKLTRDGLPHSGCFMQFSSNKSLFLSGTDESAVVTNDNFVHSRRKSLHLTLNTQPEWHHFVPNSRRNDLDDSANGLEENLEAKSMWEIPQTDRRMNLTMFRIKAYKLEVSHSFNCQDWPWRDKPCQTLISHLYIWHGFTLSDSKFDCRVRALKAIISPSNGTTYQQIGQEQISPSWSSESSSAFSGMIGLGCSHFSPVDTEESHLSAIKAVHHFYATWLVLCLETNHNRCENAWELQTAQVLPNLLNDLFSFLPPYQSLTFPTWCSSAISYSRGEALRYVPSSVGVKYASKSWRLCNSISFERE